MNTCVICIEPINENSKELYCNHVFHKKCINQWLKNNDTCPVCRKKCDNEIIVYEKKIKFNIFNQNILNFIKTIICILFSIGLLITLIVVLYFKYKTDYIIIFNNTEIVRVDV